MRANRNHMVMIVFITMTIAVLSSVIRQANAQEASCWQLKTSLAFVDMDDPLLIGNQADDRINLDVDAKVSRQGADGSVETGFDPITFSPGASCRF